LGFSDCKFQSALGFLKGRSSRFLQSSLFVLMQPCLGKIIFLVRVCSSLGEIYALMLILSKFWIFFLFSQFYVDFLFFEYCLSSGGIFIFSFICRRCFVCVYSFITLVSCSVYFERAGSLGVFLAGRVIFSSVWGSAAWSVGPVQFI
jgi:hypothetical protein